MSAPQVEQGGAPSAAGARPAQTPIANAATGTVGNLITNAITAAVVANNPEMALYVPAASALLGGLFGGLGNVSRNALKSGAFGWRYVLAYVGQAL